MSFMEQLHSVLTDRKAVTENGALGYATTGKELLDLNFAVASLRNMNEREISKRFLKAYYENPELAMKWLFFLRDIRGGLGERRSFRIILKSLIEIRVDMVRCMIPLVAEYGRFDDLLCLFDTAVESDVIEYLKEQLTQDMERMQAEQAISLCAKWMPSMNASSEESRRIAAKIRNALGITAKQYRQMLSALRKYSKVLEVSMSERNWQEISYENVPSRANLCYRKAFLRNDESRRRKFLESLARGEKSIHAGVLMPHEIVQKYSYSRRWMPQVGDYDESLEELWKHLDDQVQGADDVLCIVDGSGSMCCTVGDGNLQAIHVSNALGIYFAERMRGEYHNKFITFSAQPEYVDLSRCRTLQDKLNLTYAHDDCSNTNIEKSFELILQTAVKNKLSQRDLPKTVLVISDMEFDQVRGSSNQKTLFQKIQYRYSLHGYQMPKLVFWNCNSRTNVIPVRENEYGVALVSGFSINVCKMVLSNRLDPFACLLEQLNTERYKRIGRLCA